MTWPWGAMTLSYETLRSDWPVCLLYFEGLAWLESLEADQEATNICAAMFGWLMPRPIMAVLATEEMGVAERLKPSQ